MSRPDQKLWQKKSMGQVFLQNQAPVQAMIGLLKDWGVTRVLEIGPGDGVLTIPLLKEGFKTISVEKDERFADKLKYALEAKHPDLIGNYQMVNQDILQFRLNDWLDESKEPTAVIGNIPYNISTPILMWVLPSIHRLSGVSFLTQLEFANRLNGVPRTKNYGSLSIFAQVRAEIEFIMKVSKEDFFPVPKVDSAVFSMRAIDHGFSKEQLRKIETVTKSSFANRRKKLRNAIKIFLEDPSQEADFPIDLDRRPDSLHKDEFIEMARFLFPELF